MMMKSGVMRAALSVFLFSFVMMDAAFAAKTDVVVLINGNSVTGEVKSLEFGVLRYSTDSMGTVNIDWEDVISLTSDQSLQVEISTGTRYFGNLKQPNAPGLISVGRGENFQEVSKQSVVRLTPIETSEKLIGRFEGSVGIGLDADKGSEVATSNVLLDIGYRTRKYFIGMDLSSSIIDQSGADTTQRNNLTFNYQRFKTNRWYTDWVVSTERNDALGIDNRSTIGGGLGRYVIQTNSNQLSLLVGLNATKEDLQSGEPTTTNAEGKLTFKYLHRSLGPDTDFLFSAELYPLLEDLSSVRGESDLTFSSEFIDDLFFDVTLFYSFVGEAAVDTEKTDYGINTSLTYKF